MIIQTLTKIQLLLHNKQLYWKLKQDNVIDIKLLDENNKLYTKKINYYIFDGIYKSFTINVHFYENYEKIFSEININEMLFGRLFNYKISNIQPINYNKIYINRYDILYLLVLKSIKNSIRNEEDIKINQFILC